jgi:serine/threonine protein kinase
MFGSGSYGKPIDIWAVGFIMYELLSGKHPLYSRGEDRTAYIDKLRDFKKLKLENDKFSK